MKANGWRLLGKYIAFQIDPVPFSVLTAQGRRKVWKSRSASSN
jgi:hypothetical protein